MWEGLLESISLGGMVPLGFGTVAGLALSASSECGRAGDDAYVHYTGVWLLFMPGISVNILEEVIAGLPGVGIGEINMNSPRLLGVGPKVFTGGAFLTNWSWVVGVRTFLIAGFGRSNFIEFVEGGTTSFGNTFGADLLAGFSTSLTGSFLACFPDPGPK